MSHKYDLPETPLSISKINFDLIPPLREDHPVIRYLDWQIAYLDIQLRAMVEVQLNTNLEQFKSQWLPIGDHGLCDSAFNDLEHPIEITRDIAALQHKLVQERLRLLGDCDFRGTNYLGV